MQRPGERMTVASARPTDTSAPPTRGLLLHEWTFGALLIYLAFRSSIQISPLDAATVIPVLLLGVDAALIAWDRRARTLTSGRSRLLFHVVAMNVVYLRLGVDVPRMGNLSADAWLLSLDRRWFGETPALRLASLANPVTSELVSFCYFLFFPAMLGYQLAWLFSEPLRARRFFAGLYLVYSVGFAGYTLAPATGPWVHLASSFQPLQGGPITWLTDRIVRTGCNGIDVFPSLHIAVTTYFVGYDAMSGQYRRFLFALVPAIGLCVATVYLRYHYAVDGIAGFILGAAALFMVRPSRPTSANIPSTPESRLNPASS